jgi:hypothetical protein
VASGDSIVAQYVRVVYSCVGPRRPSARVTYPETFASCESNAAASDVHHAVSLGVGCRQTDSYLSFWDDDLLIECADVSNDFDTDDGFVRCSRGASFAAGSASFNPQTISSVAIKMDEYWFTDGLFENCFTQLSDPQNPSTTVTPAVTPPKTPTRMPPPNDAPMRLPIPGSPTSAAKVPAALVASPGTKSGGAPIGAAIGGLAAGVVLLAVFAYFVLRRRRGTSSPMRGEAATIYPRMLSADSSTSATDVAPTAPVDFKDQCRSVDGPGSAPGGGRDVVPLVHAVQVSGTLDGPWPLTHAVDTAGLSSSQ